jgi:F0F1-type ATP synthase assembly protein I
MGAAFLVIIPLMLIAVPSHVKDGEVRHLNAAQGQQVFVIDSDRREWRGTLIDVATTTFTIDGQDGTKRFVLDDIRRVDADGDRIRDGFIKGILFGAFIGAVTSQYLGAGAIPRGMLVYGAIGAGLDALNRCKQTVYRAPAPQVSATLRW